MAERPFVCHHHGCNLSFASEDRLNAHQTCHSEMARELLIPTFVADLTPTPTRFLRSFEEAGLFEMTRNPFDESFMPDRNDASENNVSEMPRPPAPIPNVILEHSLGDDNDPDDSIDVDLLTNSAEQHEAPEYEGSMTQLLASGAELLQQSANQQTTQLVQVLESANQQPTQQLVQVLVQLQSGVFMPVQIPAQALTQAMINITDIPHSSDAPPTLPSSQSIAPTIAPAPSLHENSSQVVSSTTSLTITDSTKQKLKEALKNNSENVRKTTIQSSNENKSLHFSVFSSSMTDTCQLDAPKPHSADPTSYYHSFTNSSSKLSSDDDADDQKKKFLESNRAAASRCRQKKKVWIENLETKTKGLQDLNKKLTDETQKLKREIVSLHQMLAQHSNCSVPTTETHMPSNHDEKCWCGRWEEACTLLDHLYDELSGMPLQL